MGTDNFTIIKSTATFLVAIFVIFLLHMLSYNIEYSFGVLRTSLDTENEVKIQNVLEILKLQGFEISVERYDEFSSFTATIGAKKGLLLDAFDESGSGTEAHFYFGEFSNDGIRSGERVILPSGDASLVSGYIARSPFNFYGSSTADIQFKCENITVSIVQFSRLFGSESNTQEGYNNEAKNMEQKDRNEALKLAKIISQSLINNDICEETKEDRKHYPVIFLPGVAGSDLFVNDRQVWPFAFSGNRLELKLNEEGTKSAKEGVVVTTKDIFRKNLLPKSVNILGIRDVEIPVDLREKINFYGPLLTELEKGKYLFEWNLVVGDAKNRNALVSFLNDKLGLSWVTANQDEVKFLISPDNNRISIINGSNSINIDIDEKLNSAVLKTTSTPDKKELTYYFYLDKVKGERKIYERNYLEGKDLFVFPYDWRLSNAAHFERLKQTIDTALEKNPESDKVILIAHSMGGIISRAFLLDNPDIASRVDSLITMGTPFWGTTKPFYALLMGYSFDNPFINPQLMKDIGQNFPSVYELSPRKPFIYDTKISDWLTLEESYKIKYKGFEEVIPYYKLGVGMIKWPPHDRWILTKNNIWSPNPGLVINATEFHSKGGTMANPTPLPGNVKLYTIIGTGIKTLDHFIMRDWTIKNKDKSYLEFGDRKVVLEPGFYNGDGTVSLSSLQIKNPTKAYYIPSVPGKPAAHGDLARIPCIQEIVKSIVVEGKPLRSTPASCNGPPVTLDNPQLVDLEKKVDFTLRSDAYLSIEDENGNRLGYDEFGYVYETVPTGTFLDMDGVEYASIADISKKYNVSVNGIRDGKFTLSVNITNPNVGNLSFAYPEVKVSNGTTNKFDFIPSQIANDISTVPKLAVQNLNGSTTYISAVLSPLPIEPAVSLSSNKSTAKIDTKDQGTMEFLDYFSDSLRLYLNYPSDWRMNETGNSLEITPGLQNGTDQNLARFYVFYHKNIPSFATSTDTLKANAEKTLDDQRMFYGDIEISDYSNFTLNGLPAIRAIYTFNSLDSKEFSVIAFVVINQNDLYKIFFTGPSDQFYSELFVADKIIDSMVFGVNASESKDPLSSLSASSTAPVKSTPATPFGIATSISSIPSINQTTTLPPSLTAPPLSPTIAASNNDTVLLFDNFDSENNGTGVLIYQSFLNWIVKNGTVDLIGNGFYNVPGGSGLYIDLDGASSGASILDSKQEFTLNPGTYILEFDISGSFADDTNTVTVQLGNVFNETFTKGGDSPFERILRTITIAQPTTAKLSFAHEGGDYVGIKLDNVKLYRFNNNTTTSSTPGPSTSTTTPSPIPPNGSISNLPVILVHGWNSDSSDWNTWQSLLQRDGIRFYPITFEQSDDSCGSVADHAEELQQKVEQVKTETGQEQVNIVGYSKGGLDARMYLANELDEDDVANLIMIGTPNAGTPLADLGSLLAYCTPGISDLVPGSPATFAAKNPNTNYYTIAGDWNSAAGGSPLIEGSDDGLVAVSSVESQNYFGSLGHTQNPHEQLVGETEYDLAKKVLLAKGGVNVTSDSNNTPPPPTTTTTTPPSSPTTTTTTPPSSPTTTTTTPPPPPEPQPIPPEAKDVSAETESNTPVEIQFDAQGDPNTDPNVSIVDGPVNGQLSEIDLSTGTVTYTPNPDFAGEDQFRYIVNDGTANSNVATVSITVVPQDEVEDGPVIPGGPEPIPTDVSNMQGVWDINANNFEGVMNIETIDNTGYFTGTVEFFGYPVDPIDGQYDSDSKLVTFERPLSSGASQSYTGQFDEATQSMGGSFTQSDRGGEHQWSAVLSGIDGGQQQDQPPQEDPSNPGMMTTDFLSYSDPSFNIELKYPSKWTIEKENDIISVTANLDNPSDPFNESVFIYYQNNIPLFETESETLEENVLNVLDFREQTSNDFELESSEDINFHGLPAHELVYTYTDPYIGDSKAREIVVINGDEMYKIIFVASSEQFSDAFLSAEKIFDSIVFLS